MEEAKAAAYYDELTRKGEGAARFKQGLGFSSTTATSRSAADVPARGSALPSSSSSLLSSFVRASSPTKAAEFEKQAQLETIQNKLKKKPPNVSEKAQQSSRVSRDRDRDRDRYVERERDRERRSRRRRSRSRSGSDDERRRRRDRGRRRSRSRSRSKSRSLSPRDRRRERTGGDRGKERGVGKVGKERNGAIDYAKLIEGYDKMSPAERVKANMKLQLSETAEKDATKGSGWERFEFDKEAPLDDEEIEGLTYYLYNLNCGR